MNRERVYNAFRVGVNASIVLLIALSFRMYMRDREVDRAMMALVAELEGSDQRYRSLLDRWEAQAVIVDSLLAVTQARAGQTPE